MGEETITKGREELQVVSVSGLNLRWHRAEILFVRLGRKKH